MKKSALALLFAVLFVFCSSCSNGVLSLQESETAETPSAVFGTYEGPAPSVFLYNPSGTWDTVDPDMRAYLALAREKYVSGDTSFTVQTVSNLGSKYIPVEFSFKINNDESDGLFDPVVEISESSDFSDYFSVPLSKNNYKDEVYSIPVSNLKTGANYYWRISMTSKGGFKTESEVFSFQTAPGPRILDIGGISNARDIGGWDTLDGKMVREGLVFRCAKPENVTAAGKKVIQDILRVKTELDLRNPDNSDDWPMDSPFQRTLNYINISTKSYTYFEQKPEKTARILRVFANPSNYPIIFHCTGGADRTGVWAFMLKALCGVDEIDLICDFELTNNRFRSGYSSGSFNADFPKFYNALYSLPGNTLQEKAYFYYRDQCGMSDMELNNIITMLTTDSAVYTDPPKEAVQPDDGTISVQILLRSSEGISCVESSDGSELLYTFERGTLKIQVNSDAGSCDIIFADGSSLPLFWINS